MTDQILECEGGHSWSRPGQRGRPPRFCPDYPQCKGETTTEPITESTTAFPEPNSDKPEPVIEVAAEKKPNPFVSKHMEKLRQAKIEKKSRSQAETEREDREKILAELKEIPTRIEEAGKRYSDALEKACKVQAKEEIDKAFDTADNYQKSLLNLAARERSLKALLQRGNVVATV